MNTTAVSPVVKLAPLPTTVKLSVRSTKSSSNVLRSRQRTAEFVPGILVLSNAKVPEVPIKSCDANYKQ